MQPEVIVIAGPTASGKTDLGIRVAQELNGEIISADSRQIYRYMDVGTAKPTQEEQSAVPHHLIDLVNPDTAFSAAEFSSKASEAIEHILDLGRVPIVVGGAGFYIEALFEGLSPVPLVPEPLKTEISIKVRQDIQTAHYRLSEIDPTTALSLTVSDPQRISRALEVYAHTGKPISYFQSLPRVAGTTRPSRQFCLSPDRYLLHDRINRRTDWMLEHGFVEETSSLLNRGYDRETYALKTFGYREICGYLSGEMDLERVRTSVQAGTRQYAKRQLTWFRNRASMTWVDPAADDVAEVVVKAFRAG